MESDDSVGRRDPDLRTFGPVGGFIGGAIVGALAFVVVLFSRTGYELITNGRRAAIGFAAFALVFGILGVLCGRQGLWKIFIAAAYASVLGGRRPPD